MHVSNYERLVQMSTQEQTALVSPEPNGAEVAYLHGAEAKQMPDVKPQKWNYRKIAPILALGVAILVVSGLMYVRLDRNQRALIETVNSQNSELVTARSALSELQTDRVDALEALAASELELAQTKNQLVLAIDPETVRSLELQLEKQTSLVTKQTELVSKLETELQTATSELTELDTQLNKAEAQAKSEAVRADKVQSALDGEVSLVPARAEGMLGLLGGVSLATTEYDLGEVMYNLQRPGLLNDEKQYFLGSGEVGYQNNLDRASVRWLKDNVLQVTLMLPVVRSWEYVVLDGRTRTEREQLARIGGRWGEQTEMFVLDTARQIARDLACADVGSLRESMKQLEQMANQLGQGYTVNILWMDSAGVTTATVSDTHLLSNAC